LKRDELAYQATAMNANNQRSFAIVLSLRNQDISSNTVIANGLIVGLNDIKAIELRVGGNCHCEGED
jgi:hypothetical protein